MFNSKLKNEVKNLEQKMEVLQNENVTMMEILKKLLNSSNNHFELIARLQNELANHAGTSLVKEALEKITSIENDANRINELMIEVKASLEDFHRVTDFAYKVKNNGK